MAKPKEKTEQPLVTRQPAAPAAHALSPFEEMDRMFDSLFGRAWPRSWMQPFMPSWPEMPNMNMRMPRIDVIDKDDKVIVRAEVSGVKKEDLEISVSDDTVTIRGCTRHEEKEEKGDYYRSEISRGEFARTVTLPCAVDSDKSSAKLEDGVLELTLPKLEKSKRHTIKVD
ncbi:MAG TPA: Hsp20/alpha crystallin family protein [Gammaproteobacteria bacterium]